MSAEIFLNGRVQLCCGDSLHFLRDQPSGRYDSVVTDPPYALVSIAKRFKTASALDVVVADKTPHRRTSGGFMGKQWDTGETAFAVEFWAEVLRVLKPGGHVVAFGGTRTYHRLACAIEDAGFEIRDQLGWCFGSGFPKSHSVQKTIEGQYQCRFLPIVKIAELKSKHSLVELREGMTGSVLGFVVIPREAERARLTVIGAADDSSDQTDMYPLESTDGTFLNIETLWSATSVDLSNPARRFITTTKLSTITESKILSLLPNLNMLENICGAGSALKPAWEPICLARKPLIGTVAANVLQHGTGAINIDGCRVSTDENLNGGAYAELGGRVVSQSLHAGTGMNVAGKTVGKDFVQPLGRWPANIIHNGSAEVMAAFPETSSGMLEQHHNRKGKSQIGTFDIRDRTGEEIQTFGDSGSAARFFYTAKADADDRLGSKHPTVKPVDLMQWLVRLVTPKGGLVLDPFAGTGTTAEACYREGMRCMLVERETEYQADIRRRLALVMSGLDERARESIKAKNFPVDHGPLFAETAE